LVDKAKINVKWPSIGFDSREFAEEDDGIKGATYRLRELGISFMSHVESAAAQERILGSLLGKIFINHPVGLREICI
jgi:hypothetical protein